MGAWQLFSSDSTISPWAFRLLLYSIISLSKWLVITIFKTYIFQLNNFWLQAVKKLTLYKTPSLVHFLLHPNKWVGKRGKLIFYIFFHYIFGLTRGAFPLSAPLFGLFSERPRCFSDSTFPQIVCKNPHLLHGKSIKIFFRKNYYHLFHKYEFSCMSSLKIYWWVGREIKGCYWCHITPKQYHFSMSSQCSVLWKRGDLD